MKPNLHKTLKVSAETHHVLKLLAAQTDVSMAALVHDLAMERDFRQNGHYTLEATPEEVEKFLASYEEKMADWPNDILRRDANGNLVKYLVKTGVTP